MKGRNLGRYALALAIVVVGALWAGVPVSTLAYLALVLACPLMMLFMMRGMHGGDSHEHGPQQPPADNEQQSYGHRH